MNDLFFYVFKVVATPYDYVLNSVLALDFYFGNYTVKCSSLSGDSSQVINYGCESHTVISSGKRRFSSPRTQYIKIKPSFWSSNNVTAIFKVTLDANSSGYSTGTISI
jgi:hypothetical protein